MRFWLPPGGRRRTGVGTAALLVTFLLIGCQGGEEARSPQSKSAAGRTVAAAEPVLCGGEQVVVSDDAADSGQPATAEELQARILVGQAANPQGYRRQTVIVDEGLGSFTISLPESFSPFWRNGTPSDELFRIAEERDAAWSEFWRGLIHRGDIETRAISLDTARTDGVAAVLITLTEADRESGDALGEAVAKSYRGNGGLIGEACGVRANGADGAYVEHTVSADVVGGETDRTQLQFLIPDPPNRALWGVTCDVESEMASEVKEFCRQIASTFQPLPAVER